MKTAFSSESSSEEDSDQNTDVELPESDLDESVIQSQRQKSRKKYILSSSEEDDDDPIIYSPKTRRSLGIRPSLKSLEDDSDVDIIEASGNEEPLSCSTDTSVDHPQISSVMESKDESHTKSNQNNESDNSDDDEFHDSQEEVSADHQQMSSMNQKDISGTDTDLQEESGQENGEDEKTQAVQNSPAENSSNYHEQSTAEYREESDSKDDFDVSNDGVDTFEENGNNSTDLHQSNSQVENSISGFERSLFTKVQSTPHIPKKEHSTDAAIDDIGKGLRNLDISSEIILLSDDSDRMTPTRPVSQAELSAERLKLDKLLANQQKNNDLYRALKSKLPDKGAQLLAKSKMYEEEVAQQMEVVSKLSTKEVIKERDESLKGNHERRSTSVSSWDGAQSLAIQAERKTEQKPKERPGAMVQARKMVTVDTIEKFHRNLKECPGEDILMEDPKGLKITLMDHQKYALSFMTWREKNSPRGGILADDMGTGKTLTMISLILLDKMQKNDDSIDSPTWRKKDSFNLYNGGTLVVCPASLMQQWTGEVEAKCMKKTLKGFTQHGKDRLDVARKLSKYDIVVTTYDTLSSESKRHGPMFGVHWHRVVLDEGHIVRNHKTQMAKACFELTARNKWVLTGTPVQNSVKDIYAIMKFLDCEPFCDIQYWNLYVGDKNCKAQGYKRLHTILKLIMLRRTKVELQEKKILPSLPQKEIRTFPISLSPDEGILYQKFLTYSRALFAQFLAQRNIVVEQQSKRMWQLFDNIQSKMQSNVVSNTAIFVLILRLRQICCHPGLLHMNSPEQDTDLNASSGGEGSGVAVNLVEMIERMDMGDEVAQNGKKLNKEIYQLNMQSSKIAAIIGEVKRVCASGEDKIVIVSQWSSMLNIIEMHLTMCGLDSLVLTGKTKISDRGPIIANFNDPNHPTRIFLLSLATGGVGLNLIGGNYLFMVDPHWNPQLEFQAHDRIYRMGQTKDVHVIKFVTSATMEERVVEIQQKKIDISNAVLTGVNTVKKSGLSMADLRNLFDM